MNLKTLFLQIDYELDKEHITLKECLTTLNEYNSLDYLDFINEKNKERDKNITNYNDNYIKNQYYTKIKVDEVNFYKPRNFDAYLIIWNSNQSSTIHNHSERGCIFKVLTGSLIETRYQKDTLNELGSNLLYVGCSSYIHDNQGLHKVTNSNKNSLTITLHIYSPKNHVTLHYDIIENTEELTNNNSIQQVRTYIDNNIDNHNETFYT
jgi:hypothetical protein